MSGIVDLGQVDTANIDGGTIDGTTIGSNNPAAGSFTDLTVGTSAALDGSYVWNGNSLTISDADDPETAYDALIADTTHGMGTLGTTNWRVLYLTPGTYILSGEWEIDTDYVAIVSTTPTDPTDTLVTYAANASVTMAQTASEVILVGFTVGNTGTNRYCSGLEIQTDTNDNSKYYNMKFDSTRNMSEIGGYVSAGITANGHRISGYWWNCTGNNQCARSGKDKDTDMEMWYCTFGDASIGGDQEGDVTGTGVIKGEYHYLTVGNNSIGGCAAFGMEVDSTAKFYNIKTGDRCLGLGDTCAAEIYDSTLGASCAGGWSNTTYYGTFSGHAERTSAGAHSFGQYSSNCHFTGTTIDCRIGTIADYEAGTSGSEENNSVDAGIAIRCHPWTTGHFTNDYDIERFDNGWVIDNEGATGVVTFNLPPAVVPFKITIRDVESAADADVSINPHAFQKIRELDGTLMATNEDWDSTGVDESFAETVLECFTAGEWQITSVTGNGWEQDNP